MPQATDLLLSLSETNDLVEVRIERDGQSLLYFSNETPPAVKVIGYRRATLTKNKLLEFAEREADFFDGGKPAALEKFRSSQEEQIYKYARELRKIMRKMLMLSERAKLAKSVIEEVNNLTLHSSGSPTATR